MDKKEIESMKKVLAIVTCIFLAGSMFATGQQEAAQEKASNGLPYAYPKKQLSLVVAGGAGGNMDIMARLLAPYLAEELGTNVVVENVAGGGGVTGATAYLAEAPNTDKILMQSVSNLLVSPLFSKVAYTEKDYIAVIGMADAEQGVFANPAKTGISSFADLVNFPKDKTLKYGSGGPAVWNGLLQAALYQEMGIKASNVPHKSAGEGLTNIMGGHTDVTLVSMSQGRDYVISGSIVPLFTFADEPYRYDNGVVVPTLKSLGYDMNIRSFTYWAIRGGSDAALVEYLYKAFHSVYQNPKYLEEMKKIDLVPYDVDGASIDAMIVASIPEVRGMYDKTMTK